MCVKCIYVCQDMIKTDLTVCFSSTPQDNTIDFLEFVAALNLAFREDLDHKLRWSFKVYDKDANGYVDRSELRSIIRVGPSIQTSSAINVY